MSGEGGKLLAEAIEGDGKVGRAGPQHKIESIEPDLQRPSAAHEVQQGDPERQHGAIELPQADKAE